MASSAAQPDPSIRRGLIIYPIDDSIKEEKIIPFLFNPRPINHDTSSNIEVVHIPSKVQPLYLYRSGDVQELSFTLHIYDGRVTNLVDSSIAKTAKEYIDKLIELQMPEPLLSTLTPTPPMVKIFLDEGEGLTWTGFVHDLSIVYEDIVKDMVLRYAVVELTLLVVHKKLPIVRKGLSEDILEKLIEIGKLDKDYTYNKIENPVPEVTYKKPSPVQKSGGTINNSNLVDHLENINGKFVPVNRNGQVVDVNKAIWEKRHDIVKTWVK